MDYEIHSQTDYSQNEFISLACKQIEHGYPVIIIPKEYTDTIFAVGFSDHGQILKGLGFLDGDDQKNAGSRYHLIEMLRRSSEQEELALSYIQKAAANIQK